jgi:hypothetical protein
MGRHTYSQDNLGGQNLEATSPELFSFAKNKMISVASTWEQEDLIQLLHLPISEMAFNQLQTLVQKTLDIDLDEGQDIWKHSWGKDFLSSRAYKLLVGHS